MKTGRHLALPAKKTSKSGVIVALILLLAGIGIMSYPVVATLLNNHSQAVLAQKVRALSEKNLSTVERNRVLERAQTYNRDLHSGPILDPFLRRVAPNTKLYRNYLSYLDFDGVMGSLSIPKLHLELPIYHGTFDDSLNRGAGHLFGTSLPVGGETTHTVITAHSGLGTATMFDNLPDLQPGDDFYFHVAGEVLKYEVTNTEVVLPTEISSLEIQPGKDLATLVTCTPYGINSHRLLVHAQRVPLEAGEAKKLDAQQVQSYWRWWMFIPILVAVLSIGGVLFSFWAHKRRNRNAASGEQ